MSDTQPNVIMSNEQFQTFIDQFYESHFRGLHEDIKTITGKFEKHLELHAEQDKKQMEMIDMSTRAIADGNRIRKDVTRSFEHWTGEFQKIVVPKMKEITHYVKNCRSGEENRIRNILLTAIPDAIRKLKERFSVKQALTIGMSIFFGCVVLAGTLYMNSLVAQNNDKRWTAYEQKQELLLKEYNTIMSGKGSNNSNP